MSAARDRVIALCPRGFKPVASASWTQPGGGHPPHPVAQAELERFLERSAQRYGPVETFLTDLFTDAANVGVMYAALVDEDEDGIPDGLLRLAPRDVLRTFDGLAPMADTGGVEFVVDVWETAPAALRARAPALLAAAEAPDHILAPLVRHLQGRCSWLLKRLLQPVLKAQAIDGVFLGVSFTDPSEREAGDASPASPAEPPRAPPPAAVPRPRGGRPPGSLKGFPPGSHERVYELILLGLDAGETHENILDAIVTTFRPPKKPARGTYMGWVKKARTWRAQQGRPSP